MQIQQIQEDQKQVRAKRSKQVSCLLFHIIIITFLIHFKHSNQMTMQKCQNHLKNELQEQLLRETTLQM